MLCSDLKTLKVELTIGSTDNEVRNDGSNIEGKRTLFCVSEKIRREWICHVLYTKNKPFSLSNACMETV